MNIKKIVGLLTALVMLVSLCQFSFAAELSSTEILIGENQTLDLGTDMNGRVNQYSIDSAIPYNAQYTNGFYVQGAQVRTTDPLGLRFIIVNNTNIKTKMQNAGINVNNLTYGALVDYDTNLLLTLENAKAVPANSIYSTNSSAKSQKYTVCITGIPDSNLRSEIYVRPYVQYTDLDGTERVLYGEQYSCDIYSAAYTAYNYGNENTSTKNSLEENILSKVTDKEGNNPCGDGYLISSDDPIIEDLRNKTDAQISKIKHSTNMSIPEDATVYYVSNNGSNSNDGKSPATAWKTITKVNDATLNAGDYVLFERGGYFRGSLKAKSGVTYSAYGTGEKPIICGSPEDGADPNKWTEVADNVWMYTPTIGSDRISGNADNKLWKDIGSIVFTDSDGKEYYAKKWLILKNSAGQLVEFKSKIVCPDENIYTALQEDLDFLHLTHHYTSEEYNNGYWFSIFLYSEENPGERFDSIEFLQNEDGISISGNDVTIDNLCIKYVGAHGVNGGKKNITVSNCEFYFIGGSVAEVKTNSTTGEETPTRWGNGVQIYGGCENFTVKNCYFYQIYDAAVSHQYDFRTNPTDMTDRGHYNVTFKNNVMEYCTYSIEFFLANVPDNNSSIMDNILYEGNHMWYCGQGIGRYRPNESQAAHIKGWEGIRSYVGDLVIKNNIIALSEQMLLQANLWHITPTTSDGVKLINNTFVGKYGQDFGILGYWTSTTSVKYDYSIKNYLNSHTWENYKYSFSHNDQFYFILN